MSLQERLEAIQHKQYQPIYSGKIDNRKSRKQCLFETPKNKPIRPKTTASPAINFGSHAISSRPTTRTWVSRHLSKDHQEISINFEKKVEDCDSINLSLFSLESVEYVSNREKYGRFNYSSYFERYMNRKAIVKIPQNLMPKCQSEVDNDNEPTIFEMLASDESKNLYELYETIVAKPPRIRSNSQSHDRKSNQFFLKDLKRFQSLDDLVFIKHAIKDNHLVRKELEKEEKLFENNQSENFDVRGIKGPKSIDQDLKSKPKSESENKNIKKKRPYSHVNSKLASYLSFNRHSGESLSNLNQSRKAIATHDIFKKEFLFYTTCDKIKPKEMSTNRLLSDSYLKMDQELEERIKIDLKVNRGPIYFVQLTEENLDAHNKTKKKVQMSQKYFYLFNWLENIVENECQHFYLNPFFQDKFCETYEKNNLILEPRNKYDNFNLNIGFRACTRFKIDPFKNPISETTVDKLPKKHRSHKDTIRFYETQEKQTLICTKDYKSMLKLEKNFSLKLDPSDKYNKMVDHDSGIKFARDQLKRQKELNDLLFAQSRLDLFIL